MGKFFGKSSNNDKAVQSEKQDGEVTAAAVMVESGPRAQPEEPQQIGRAEDAIAVTRTESLTHSVQRKPNLLDAIRPVSKLAAPELRAACMREYANLLVRQDDPRDEDGNRLRELMEKLGLTVVDVEYDAAGATRLQQAEKIKQTAVAKAAEASRLMDVVIEIAAEITMLRELIRDAEKRRDRCGGEADMIQRQMVSQDGEIMALQSSHPRIFGKDDPFGPYHGAIHANDNHRVHGEIPTFNSSQRA